MKRRHVLKRLLQTSSGLIGANLLVACDKARDPLFSQEWLNPATPLPEHLVTPVGDFYVQSYALPPTVRADAWRLEITGAVDRPLQLTYADILKAPQTEFHLTMECIGNPAGGDLIGNARWQGTALAPFLQRAGIQPHATELVLQGADSYETTLPIAVLMRPDVQLVHQMNQAPLTKAHGYPVRLIVPGYFGQKQPKWLVKLEAIAQAKPGYWERQGWSNQAEIPLHSLIRQVQATRVSNRQTHVRLDRQSDLDWTRGVLLAGVALDKASVIDHIHISTDGGTTWNAAGQTRPTSPHEWTVWRYLWRPTQPGNYTLLARAESQDQRQPLDDANSRDGSSGILRINVTLVG